MSLEFLRRMAKAYDNHLHRQHQLADPGQNGIESKGLLPSRSSGEATLAISNQQPFRPNVKQQAARATLHMLQFAVAYFVMLLAMYYNGFILVSICIGAWFGWFVFSWKSVNLRYVLIHDESLGVDMDLADLGPRKKQLCAVVRI
jgi:solute carrier family 31 (copper transporter), member 1